MNADGSGQSRISTPSVFAGGRDTAGRGRCVLCWIWAALLSRRRVSKLLALSQLDSSDLAGQRLRKIVDELDPARIGVLREPSPYEVRDLCRQLLARVVPGGEHDERLHHGAPPLIR